MRAPVELRNRVHPSKGEQHTMDRATDFSGTSRGRWAAITLALMTCGAELGCAADESVPPRRAADARHDEFTNGHLVQ